MQEKWRDGRWEGGTVREAERKEEGEKEGKQPKIEIKGESLNVGN